MESARLAKSASIHLGTKNQSSMAALASAEIERLNGDVADLSVSI